MHALPEERPMRPRRHVAAGVLKALKPLLRFSYTRDAYVLRVVGNRHGPVLRRSTRP
jgi:hypothetical protein